eukprot:805867-Rhodomonas_salina.2
MSSKHLQTKADGRGRKLELVVPLRFRQPARPYQPIATPARRPSILQHTSWIVWIPDSYRARIIWQVSWFQILQGMYPAKSDCPSGSMARQSTVAFCGIVRTVRTRLPVCASQSLTVPSNDPDATCCNPSTKLIQHSSWQALWYLCDEKKKMKTSIAGREQTSPVGVYATAVISDLCPVVSKLPVSCEQRKTGMINGAPTTSTNTLPPLRVHKLQNTKTPMSKMGCVIASPWSETGSAKSIAHVE